MVVRRRRVANATGSRRSAPERPSRKLRHGGTRDALLASRRRSPKPFVADVDSSGSGHDSPTSPGNLACPENFASGDALDAPLLEAVDRRDYTRVRELAFSPCGFGSPRARRRAWLFLLGVHPAKVIFSQWRQLLLLGLSGDSSEARIMRMDVQRSVYSWDVHTRLKTKVRDQKRLSLSEVMHATLQKHREQFAYFQGFHDIVLVFLEVGSLAEAFHMVEHVALFYLTDQLCCPFQEGLIPLLGVLFVLVQKLDPEIAAALTEAEAQDAHFAVPWLLTWFAHCMPKLHSQVLRLFDCLLSSHPAMVLYFAAALLIQNRQLLLQVPREMPDMMAAIQQLPLADLDVNRWARSARELEDRLPPDVLLAALPEELLQVLPAASPLFHYPHPWMLSGGFHEAGETDVCSLAPVYNPAATRMARLRIARLSRRRFLRFCARPFIQSVLARQRRALRSAWSMRRILAAKSFWFFSFVGGGVALLAQFFGRLRD